MANIEKYLLGLIFLLFAASASATPITIQGSAASNVDEGEATLVTLNSPTGGTITDLDLYIDFDSFVYGSDNTVILSHLDTGTSAAIWYDAKDVLKQYFGDVRNTTFDDEALIAFVDAQLIPNADTFNRDIYPGKYKAAELLSVFDGEDFSGTWQLSIQNTGTAIGEGDDLLAWKIIADVTTVPVPAPGPLGVLALGLAGFGLTRRRKTLRTL
jgi:MYXO-CTERM domain-containing protein